MPNDLINTDPIVAQNFFLAIDGEQLLLSGVSGLDLELDVVTIQQNGPSGKKQAIKTLGNSLKVPDISMTRMAPMDAMNDPIWKWFHAVRDEGFSGTKREGSRKNGSIVLYDTAFTEIGRFNFFNGWPSKISTDGLSTDSNDPVKETVTLIIERLERIK
ncbi:phage tail-like protein [Jatrophihabitans sp. GAS493]|uniref:phage tail protein n=1 Tax=Jatrophihabitans sp. GAS493 TaxID=1907575 RepID=UPI000BB69722|nr:phage tail protein [Jatrophihabitans sp. GAS493]SOD70934.1 phage tail-like protein [Jatrophihabitans sp. GAS493]